MNVNPDPNQPDDHDARSDSATGPKQTEKPGNQEEQIPAFISQPDRLDKWIWAYLVAATIFGFAMIPLRVWLLNNPVPYALMVGGYTSSIVGGAESTTGGISAVAIVLMTLVGALKTVPLWWLVGNKWGLEYLRMSVAHSPRLKRWTARLEHARPGVLGAAIVLSYIPFVPTIVIANLLAGIRRMGFWTVLGLNAFGVLVTNTVFAYLGVTYGEQVISIVEQVNRYAMWVTIALLVFMFWSISKQNKKAA